MSDDYISREAALEVFCRWCGICPKEKQKPLECDDILGNVLHSLPAADVRPVAVARLEYRHTKNGDGLFCTNCGELWTARKIGKYCYNCGADMSEYFTERKRRYEGG